MSSHHYMASTLLSTQPQSQKRLFLKDDGTPPLNNINTNKYTASIPKENVLENHGPSPLHKINTNSYTVSIPNEDI